MIFYRERIFPACWKRRLWLSMKRVLIVSLETDSRECPWVQALTSTFFSLMEYLTFWAGKRKKTRPSSDSLSPLKQVHSQTDRHKQLLHHVFLVLVNQLNLSRVKLVLYVSSILYISPVGRTSSKGTPTDISLFKPYASEPWHLLQGFNKMLIRIS